MINSISKLSRRIHSERRNIGFFFVTNVIALVSSFLLIIAFANLVDKNTYGTYQYILSITSVIGSISLTGIGSAFIRAIGKKEFGFIHYGQKHSVVWSLLPIVVGGLISGYYLFNANYTLAVGVFVSVLIITITHYFSRFIFILNGMGDFFKSNLIQTSQSLAPLIFLFPALLFLRDPISLTVVYFGSIALATLAINFYLGTPKILKRLNDEAVVNATYNKLNLKFAFHHSIINLINVITANFDKILLFQTLGAQQTASYIIAISIPNRIRSLIKQFEPYVFAKFANHTAKAVHSNITSKFILTLLLSIPFFLCYATFAILFFHLFMPQYSEVAILSIIYALSIFGGASLVPYAALKAHASEKYFYWYTVISSATQIIFLLAGASVAGLAGAIIGKMVATLFNTVFVFFLSLWIGKSTDSSHAVVSTADISS